MRSTIGTMLGATAMLLGAGAQASAGDGLEDACRALDAAARSAPTTSAGARSLLRTQDLERHEWIVLAGLDDLTWEGTVGTEVRVPLRDHHVALLRAVVACVYTDRGELRSDALDHRNAGGFRATALAVGRLASASESEWLSATASRAGRGAADRDALAEAVHLWVRRTDPGPDSARRLLADCTPETRAAVVVGLLGGPAGGPRCVDARSARRALALLGEAPALDRFIASLIAERARSIGDTVDASALIRLLDAEDATGRAHAANALGALMSMAAIEALVGQLDDPDPRARRAALRALRRTSRQSLDASPAAWRAWHRASRTWLAEALPDVASDLRSGLDGHAARALLEIGRHPEHARWTAPLVVTASRDPEPGIAALAAAILGTLATPEALERLTEMLRGNPDEVRAAARTALRRATGEDHGPDPEAWRAALTTPR